MELEEIKKIENHKDSIFTLLLLYDGRLASSSGDKTIKIFSLINYACELTLKGHKDRVLCIAQLINYKLISSSGDRTIKIWTISPLSYTCDFTIDDFTSAYINRLVVLPLNRFASSSMNKTIKIWNSDPPYSLIKVLIGHTKKVKAMLIINNNAQLLSPSEDNTIRFWNINTYQSNTIINEIFCSANKNMIEINNKQVAVGGKSIIQIINVIKYCVDYSIKDNCLAEMYSLMKLRGGDILAGCYSGRLYLYSVTEHLIEKVKEKAHQVNITCLVNINDNMFASGSSDNFIKIWKY